MLGFLVRSCIDGGKALLSSANHKKKRAVEGKVGFMDELDRIQCLRLLIYSGNFSRIQCAIGDCGVVEKVTLWFWEMG